MGEDGVANEVFGFIARMSGESRRALFSRLVRDPQFRLYVNHNECAYPHIAHTPCGLTENPPGG